MTVEDLATKLGKSVGWVNLHLRVSPNIKPIVVWQTYNRETDLYRLAALLCEIGEPFKQPFLDNQGVIIMMMSDDFAFIFDKEGKRK